jgi:hypothetical protein
VLTLAPLARACRALHNDKHGASGTKVACHWTTRTPQLQTSNIYASQQQAELHISVENMNMSSVHNLILESPYLSSSAPL